MSRSGKKCAKYSWISATAAIIAVYLSTRTDTISSGRLLEKLILLILIVIVGVGARYEIK